MPTYGRASKAQNRPGRRQDREAAGQEPWRRVLLGAVGWAVPAAARPAAPLCASVPGLALPPASRRSELQKGGREEPGWGSPFLRLEITGPEPAQSHLGLPPPHDRQGPDRPLFRATFKSTAMLTELGRLGVWTPERAWCHLGGRVSWEGGEPRGSARRPAPIAHLTARTIPEAHGRVPRAAGLPALDPVPEGCRLPSPWPSSACYGIWPSGGRYEQRPYIHHPESAVSSCFFFFYCGKRHIT